MESECSESGTKFQPTSRNELDMNFLYTHLLKPILFLFHPDRMHDLFIQVGEFCGKYKILRNVLGFFYNYSSTDISTVVDGIRYRTPVILSAGFDANGRLTQILKYLSFGGVEVGSVTALPCEGNPRPNMTRLIRNKSIVVYKGLKNNGVDALITRLNKIPLDSEFVIGISIARTNSHEACVDVDTSIADYVTSFQKLNDAEIGDYYTINISCPNTFDGETFTTPILLSKLLTALSAVPTKRPVYIKMPINHSWDEFNALLEVADTYAFIRGVVIGNLNKNYNELDFPDDAPKEYRGGLSGKPCFARSNELIRKTRASYNNRFTIIGCGGIFTPQDAQEKILAGADLVQIISGLVFNGPGLPKEICSTPLK